jgi:hypothetical protein
MQVVTTVGLDIATSAFQVHGVDAAGQVVIRRQLKRRSVVAFFTSTAVRLRRVLGDFRLRPKAHRMRRRNPSGELRD